MGGKSAGSASAFSSPESAASEWLADDASSSSASAESDEPSFGSAELDMESASNDAADAAGPSILAFLIETTEESGSCSVSLIAGAFAASVCSAAPSSDSSNARFRLELAAPVRSATVVGWMGGEGAEAATTPLDGLNDEEAHDDAAAAIALADGGLKSDMEGGTGDESITMVQRDTKNSRGKLRGRSERHDPHALND